MPELTPSIGLKKPLGNEYVTRQAHNENLDIIDGAIGGIKSGTTKVKTAENADTAANALKLGGQLPAYYAKKTEVDAKETPAGAQAKVDSHANRTDNPHNVTKSQVGLGSVDNIQQATKSEFDAHNIDSTRHITYAERTTWNAKETPAGAQAKVDTHEAKKTNPHGVTKAQVGLGSVDNVKQASKTEHDSLQTQVNSHLAENMPHKFTDGATTYRWGLSVINGVVTMNYEEVV